MKRTILIFSLDGGTLDVITPLVQAGRLPVLRRFMAEGSHGRLESTIHPMTAPAWISFMTGKNQGKHGIYDFTQKKAEAYAIEYVNARCCKSQTIWKIASHHGKRVGVFNMPLTFPPEEVNGFMIAGFGTPGKESKFTYPEELYGEIVDNFGTYRLLEMRQSSPEMCFESLLESIDQTTKISKYLFDKQEWELFAVTFYETDHIQHFFWHCMDQNHPCYTPDLHKKYGDFVFKIYEKIDAAIGQICDYVHQEKVVIIMSDHGAGPIKKYINLNSWLRDMGLLEYKKSKILESKISGAVRFGARKFLTSKWKHWIMNVNPKIKDKFDSRLFFSTINWKKTKAYAMGSYGNIYINLKGREPQGIVETNDYKAIREEIAEKLYLLKDPDTGESVVEKVHMRENLYNGHFVDNAPDIIVVYRDYSYFSMPSLRNAYKRPTFEMHAEDTLGKVNSLSYHRLHGITLFHGEGIKRDYQIKGAKIIDLAPMILYLACIPIPEDMDGRVLTEIFDEEYLEQHQITFSPQQPQGIAPHSQADYEYSKDEAGKIEKRLSDLGYL
ncbi:MAG: alkaline phosphatase family protein [Methanomassiliicoccales archaeon]|nr:MAG: alkaline phosphatase family protein [Methanomassiliicoccales archaeon]